MHMIYDMIYLLTAIGLTSGGSSTVHMCIQTIHRRTLLTTLVGRLSGIRTQSGQTNWEEFYVHVTVHRNKFLYNKTNHMHQFPKCTLAWNSTLSGVYSLYTRHWYMSFRYEDSFRAGIPSWSCSKAVFKPVWHTSAECTVNKLLIMGRGTGRNM